MFIDRKLPKDITIKNTSDEPISFRFYGVNIVQTLDVGEELVITGASSEATGFYLAQMDDVKGLSVEAYAPDEPEPHPQPQPGVTHTVTLKFIDENENTLLCNPTLDDKPGEEDAEGYYTWYDVEEGIHTVRVDCVGYEVLQDDISVLDDYSTSYILSRDETPTVDIVAIRLKNEDDEVLVSDSMDIVMESQGISYIGEWNDVDEYFEFHDVIANETYEVHYSDISDYMRYEDAMLTIHVSTDDSSDYQYFEVVVPREEEPEETYSVSFRFEDENRNTVSNLDSVTFDGIAGRYNSAEGTYEWEDVTPGTYALNVIDSRFISIYTSVVVTDYNVSGTYTLNPKTGEYYNVYITFVDAGSNEPITDLETVAISGNDGYSITNNRYEWYNVTPDEYDVWVRDSRYEELHESITVDDDFISTIELTPVEEPETTWTVQFIDVTEDGSEELYDGGSVFGTQDTIDGEYATRPNTSGITPPQENYEFMGFYTDAQIAEEFDFENTPIYDNTDIFVAWRYVEPEPIEYTVTFVDLDSAGDRVLPDGESTVPSQLVMEGDCATRPNQDPELDGYSFGGFYENQDFVNPFSFDETPIYDDTEIYVLWHKDDPEEDYYSVEIGFTDEDGNQVVDLENITLDGIEGEMTDNNTYGWSDFVGGTYSLHIEDSRFQTVDTTIEIYEDYTDDMMLTFNKGTVYLKFIDSDTGDTLTIDNLHIEESVRGYYYNGEEDSNGNYVFNDVRFGNYNVIYEPPLDYNPGLDNIDVSQHPTTITISLYPVEEPDLYGVKIRFVNDDGDTVMPNVIPTLDGVSATYEGDIEYYAWYDVETGTHTLIADFNTPFIGINQEIIVADSDYEEIIQLEVEEPEPEPDQFNVEFIDIDETSSEINGGGSIFENQQVYDSELATRPDTDFVQPPQDNYTFVDFYSDNAMSEKFDFDSPIDGDTTIYAVWHYEVQTHGVNITFLNSGNEPVIPTDFTITNEATGNSYSMSNFEEETDYSFTLNDVEEGDYDIQAYANGYDDFSDTFTLDSDRALSFTLTEYEEPEEPEVYYSITYRDVDENGNYITDGGSVVSNSTELEGSILERPAWTPGKDGYTFDDFCADINGNTPYEFGNEIHSDETIYVRFIKDEEGQVFDVLMKYDGEYVNSGFTASLATYPNRETVIEPYSYGDTLAEDDTIEVYAAFFENVPLGTYYLDITYDNRDFESLITVTEDTDRHIYEYEEPAMPQPSIVNITVQDESGNALECDNAYAIDWENKTVPYDEYDENTCTYTWNQLSADLYHFHFEKDGFEDKVLDVSCLDDSVDNLTCVMTPIEEPEEPEEPEEQTLCTVKVGFNAEDDGVDNYVLVDNAKLEVTSVVSGDVPDEVFIPTVDENNMYVFVNVPEGSYQISGTKSGYARFDESRDSVGQIVNGVYTTEITLYTASTMSVIFTDSFGDSVTVDTVRIVDENDNEMSTFSVETQGDGVDKPVDYVYTSNTPLVNGTYYLVATKSGYKDVREEIEIDGWMNLTINLVEEI